MREIPLLMQPEMVRGSILGNKTETRRLRGLEFLNENPDQYKFHGLDDKGDALFEDLVDVEITPWITPIKCPYGKVDDFIYVRENWNKDGYGGFLYAADYGIREHMRWRPSIHLPKFASRLWLQVVSIGIERLQSISPGDACNEGVEYENVDTIAFEGGELVADFHNYSWKDDPESRDYNFPMYANAVDSYLSLWAKINGWDSVDLNPWVWVIKYQVMSTTGRPEILDRKEVAHA